MGNSTGSMFYMVLIFIVLYVAGVAIYGGFKAFQKWREQIRDRKFRSEEQGRSQKKRYCTQVGIF